MSPGEIEALAARLPRVDLGVLGQGLAGGITGGTLGELILHRHPIAGFLGGTTAGALIGSLGGERRRALERAILRSSLRRQRLPLEPENIRTLAKRMTPAAGTTLGTAGISGLLSAALGGALQGGRGALYSGVGGAGLGLVIGALHAAANRSKVRGIVREEAARQAGARRVS
jgi:hypothetical protein